MVPCILLPHGLPRLALRCALWRKPDNRHAQRLSELGFALTHYRQAYVRKSGISGRCGCVQYVYEPETEEPRRPRVRFISDSVYLLRHSRWLAGRVVAVMLCFAFCFASFSAVDRFVHPCGGCVIGDVAIVSLCWGSFSHLVICIVCARVYCSSL